MWLVLILAGRSRRHRRHHHRPADAAPARRLPRDRDARLRRDHPAGRPQRRQAASGRPQGGPPFIDFTNVNLTNGVRASARSTRPASARTSTRPQEASCPTASLRTSSSRGTSRSSCSLLITVFCIVRLRDSRLGRAWIAIREDETAAAAMGVPLMRTKTWAYAHRRVLRRRRRRLLRELHGRRLPDELLLQHLGLPALHGHPRRDGERLGRHPRRR